MSKKGLISSLIIGLVMTLALSVYTIVSVAIGDGGKPFDPTNTTVSMAYRTDDVIDVLTGYDSEAGNVKFETAESVTELPFSYNQETGEYTATSAGEVTAVLKLDDKGNTKIVNIAIYQQGDGSSADSAYILTQASHLKEFADLVNTVSATREVPAFTKMVADIDLIGYNWKPIGGEGDLAYTGEFDGNGHTIKNLSISVNDKNYQDFVTVSTKSENRGFIDLGLFGRVVGATIKNVNISNAKINVDAGVYDLINVTEAPEGAEYGYIVRLSIGTLAGAAYNTDIIGCDDKNTVVSRINGFSATTAISGKAQGHGIGGLVGGAQLVRVSNYKVSVNVLNNLTGVKSSIIGGVFGQAESSYIEDFAEEQKAEDKTIVENVDVDFVGSVLYNNVATVGGVVGYGRNVGINDTIVKGFKIVDSTVKASVEYMSDPTIVAGVAGRLTTNTTNLPAEFATVVENVSVYGVDIYMLGGDAAGAFGKLVGSQVVTVNDVTVEGAIASNTASGFAYQVGQGTTVSYTKAFETEVVNVSLKAHMSAGFAYWNIGKILGYNDGSDYKTEIRVATKGMGAQFNSNSTNEDILNARNNTFASGFVAYTYTAVEEVTPIISDFDIFFTANSSLNMSGVAHSIEDAIIQNVDVEADFISYNYSTTNYTSTYMVAGVAAIANAGATIDNVNVKINANSNVNKTKVYGASFFGGIVARYYGDSATAGLTITNCQVSGNVYFNAATESVVWNDETYKVFLAGGLVGAMQTDTIGGSEDDFVDDLAPVSIAKTVITGNSVSELTLVADFKDVVAASAQAWRARAIGALVGVVNNTDADELDLSTNVVSQVAITADSETFVYTVSSQGVPNDVEIITIGFGKTSSVGITYNRQSDINEPNDLDVTYTEVE